MRIAILFAALLAVGAREIRERTLAGMLEVMGSPPSRQAVALEIRVVEEEPLEGITRRKIAYVSEDGDSVPAYLFVPYGGGRRRAVVCLHQTTKIGKAEPAGLGPKVNLHYAIELARRGYVTIAPDYPNYGDYTADAYAMGYQSASMKGVRNHRRAIDVLASLKEVDKGRIGAIGHSLGGHNALFLAAFDERIRAVVTSCGFTSFHRYYGGDLTGWSHKGYMPRIAAVYGKDPARMPFDFPGVLISIAPRAVFINAPVRDANFDVTGVRESVEAARPHFKNGRLVAIHPEAGHDFPPEVRKQAYAFLDRWL
jgi:dienelactone hydrolase